MKHSINNNIRLKGEHIMKLKEIIEKLEIGHIIRELIKVEISHIPLITKRSIMNSVADLSLYINEVSQMMSRDLILQEMFTTLLVLLETTDIELEGLVDENGDVDSEAIATWVDAHIKTPEIMPDLGQGVRSKTLTGKSQIRSRDDLRNMTPEEILVARKEGRLDSLMGKL
jgi:hypothetical protein